MVGPLVRYILVNPLELALLSSLRMKDREPVATFVSVWVVRHCRKGMGGGGKEGRKELSSAVVKKRDETRQGETRLQLVPLPLSSFSKETRANCYEIGM